MAGMVDRLLVCPNCHMTFASPTLLHKHQAKFCVAGPYESPRRVEPSRMSYNMSPVGNGDSNVESSKRKPTQPPNVLKSSLYIKDLRDKNRTLENQKYVIDQRLQELQGQGDWYHNQMNLQHFKNKQRIDELRDQTRNLRIGRPATVDQSLLAAIIETRQNYLRQGGRNKNLLQQMGDLEQEAKLLEQNNAYAKKMRKVQVSELQYRAVALEAENDSLRNELELLQSKNEAMIRDLKNSNMNNKEAEKLKAEAKARHQDYMSRLHDLENEVELTKQQARLERLRQHHMMNTAMVEPVYMPAPVPIAAPEPVRIASTPRAYQSSRAYLPPFQYSNYAADVPYLISGLPAHDAFRDGLNTSHYDEQAGFMVFYDFVTGLDGYTQAVRLITCLYNEEAQFGEPTSLPTCFCEPMGQGTTYSSVLTKQPVPGCPPALDMSLIIELQTAHGGYGNPGRLSTKGWAKLLLFDQQHRLRAGRYRLPVKVMPLQPEKTVAQINAVPQFGTSELFLRIVNMRDADAQSMAQPTLAHLYLYQLPYQDYQPVPSRGVHTGPQSYAPSVTHSPARSVHDETPAKNNIIGFQIDRVKKGGRGEGKVRLTAYYKNSGKLVQSAMGPVTCCSSPVKNLFKYNYHVFGQQEASFRDIQVDESDIMLIARFYLRRAIDPPSGATDLPPMDDEVYDKESLVAWSFIPLLTYQSNGVEVNTGTHFTPLLVPPVPEVSFIPDTAGQFLPRTWQRYNKGSIRIHIFEGKPRTGDPTDSEDSDTEMYHLPKDAWLPGPRVSYHNTKLIKDDDVIYLYIDGARFLPNNVSVTRVSGRILDVHHEVYGPPIETNVQLDSDIYHPIYKSRVEIAEDLPPTATLILMVYTVDRYTDDRAVAGFAALNLFVLAGTSKQPEERHEEADTPVEYSLNEGAHQIRLYLKAPATDRPFYEGCFKDQKIHYIPCASLLVRLYQAPRDEKGKVILTKNVRKEDWVKMRMVHPFPTYSSGIYQSEKCQPTSGEVLLFRHLMSRQILKTRDVLKIVGDQEDMQTLTTDQELKDHITDMLTKEDDTLFIQCDLNTVCDYFPQTGIKVAIDAAKNLPWTGFTHAAISLSPPAAYYRKKSPYDRPKITKKLDVNSTCTNPVWLDGYISFPNRTFNKYLTFIIHLQEITVIPAPDGNKYGLAGQAWTALSVFPFELPYIGNGAYQLPLFKGSPSVTILNKLIKQYPGDWQQTELKPIDYASVLVRIADARRAGEFPEPASKLPVEELSVMHIPLGKRDGYFTVQDPGKPLSEMIPEGKQSATFISNLATIFHSLLYKLADERSIPMAE